MWHCHVNMIGNQMSTVMNMKVYSCFCQKVMVHLLVFFIAFNHISQLCSAGLDCISCTNELESGQSAIYLLLCNWWYQQSPWQMKNSICWGRPWYLTETWEKSSIWALHFFAYAWTVHVKVFNKEREKRYGFLCLFFTLRDWDLKFLYFGATCWEYLVRSDALILNRRSENIS